MHPTLLPPRSSPSVPGPARGTNAGRLSRTNASTSSSLMRCAGVSTSTGAATSSLCGGGKVCVWWWGGRSRDTSGKAGQQHQARVSCPGGIKPCWTAASHASLTPCPSLIAHSTFITHSLLDSTSVISAGDSSDILITLSPLHSHSLLITHSLLDSTSAISAGDSSNFVAPSGTSNSSSALASSSRAARSI